ncbi:hypothetical protein EJB05_28645 [Eragrostis curvula]|uniref:F-box domain-containing protein n=1 Tax=Eragrostis curvula TaxID=38414 RepID=A0A5J9UQQ3_9POAL|nr:hypothetical protein EJB05_28645 [Eragrostis curvula]
MPPLKKCEHDMGAAAGDGEGIDVLPDGVLAHVLGFLPTEEAVRTCVLTRRWRHLWKSATGLHVVAADGKFLGTVEKLVQFLDCLLTLREGASLETCELEVGSFSVLSGYSHVDVDEDMLRRLSIWFRHAVTRRVRFLSIRLLCANQEFVDLPLVSQLHCVQLSSSLLDFSSCSALEYLVFVLCDTPISEPTENNISLKFPKSLKYLTMNESYFGDPRIHIYAPSLVTLHLDEFGGLTPVLGSMPSLLEAFVRITSLSDDKCRLRWGDPCACVFCESSDNNGGDSNNSVLLKGLSEARNLTLISDPEMVSGTSRSDMLPLTTRAFQRYKKVWAVVDQSPLPVKNCKGKDSDGKIKD